MNNIQTITFNDIFAKYKNITDKYESLYIFVVYDTLVEVFLEKIHKMINIADEISNPSKKYYIKSRLYSLVQYLDGIKLGTKIENIYLVGNNVNEICLEKSWKKTLVDFYCDNIIVNYGETYQLNWLKNLLLDISFVNVIHLKNNTLKHLHINTTKKRLHVEKNEKKMDIEQYIKDNILDDICIVHGVSSFLKTLKEDKKIKILNGDKRDDELIEKYMMVCNEKNSEQLEWWLDRLLDPKEGKKIVFGVDIKLAIKDKLLKTLFCTPEVKQKIIDKAPLDEQIFEIIEIKSFGFNDIGNKLDKDFNGAVGIKFY